MGRGTSKNTAAAAAERRPSRRRSPELKLAVAVALAQEKGSFAQELDALASMAPARPRPEPYLNFINSDVEKVAVPWPAGVEMTADDWKPILEIAARASAERSIHPSVLSRMMYWTALRRVSDKELIELAAANGEAYEIVTGCHGFEKDEKHSPPQFMSADWNEVQAFFDERGPDGRDIAFKIYRWRGKSKGLVGEVRFWPAIDALNEPESADKPRFIAAKAGRLDEQGKLYPIAGSTPKVKRAQTGPAGALAAQIFTELLATRFGEIPHGENAIAIRAQIRHLAKREGKRVTSMTNDDGIMLFLENAKTADARVAAAEALTAFDFLRAPRQPSP